MRFLGNIQAKIDAKGRAFLPAQFRKMLTASGEESLVLRQDIYERILVLYPDHVWAQLMDEMRSRLSRWDRQEQMVYRTFVSGVASVGVDGNGRILIPRQFLEAVGIGQGIRFVGMGDTIEIWPDSPELRQPLLEGGDFGKAMERLLAERKEKQP